MSAPKGQLLDFMRCIFTHGEHHFVVRGVTLCRLCDANLLSTIAKATSVEEVPPPGRHE